MALHRVETGTGIPAVLVHGSFGWGLDTFPEQQVLSDEFRVVLVDRNGFGATPAPDRDVLGWPLDGDDVGALLVELGGAHLVGQSYGAVVALLAASRNPVAVRSLVVIEPPLFDLAAGDPDADRVLSAMRPVRERAPTMTGREYVYAWADAAIGRTASQVDAWTATWSPADWAAADASRRERWPGEAPIDLAVLAALDVPKVVVAGGWAQDSGAALHPAGRAFRAVADRLAPAIGAEIVEFEHSSHNPQLEEPDRFNELLRATWRSGRNPA